MIHTNLAEEMKAENGFLKKKTAYMAKKFLEECYTSSYLSHMEIDIN